MNGLRQWLAKIQHDTLKHMRVLEISFFLFITDMSSQDCNVLQWAIFCIYVTAMTSPYIQSFSIASYWRGKEPERERRGGDTRPIKRGRWIKYRIGGNWKHLRRQAKTLLFFRKVNIYCLDYNLHNRTQSFYKVLNKLSERLA